MELLERALIGILLGVSFGVYGFFMKSPDGEDFNWKKLSRTVMVYGAMGVMVGLRGSDSIACDGAFTIALGEAGDKAVARMVRKNVD